MKKIAFHLNCLEQGGAERVVTNLSHQFAQAGYDVSITTQWQGENEFQINDKVKRVHVGLRSGDEKKGRITQFFLRVKYLREYIKQEKPDVVIAFAQRANYRALMAKLGTKCPVIIAVRTDPVGNYDAISDKIQIPILFPHADGCVFQTTGQRAFFPKYVQKKSRIIINPIHEKYLSQKPPEIRTKTVVQSGRLVDFKNQLMLIKAFVEVHKKHPEYNLKIYGGDSFDGTKDTLETCIKENHAAEYVTLMGGSDSLEQELNDAAIFAFSSDWEGMPNTLLEAMALGLPIVATDCPCGGPATVMEHGVNGMMIATKDQEAMTASINYLIEHPIEAKRMGDNARKIGTIANGQAIFEQWRAYIDSIIAAK